jgi:signal transduction histidine kinase
MEAWLSRDAATNNRRLILTRWLAGVLVLVLTAFTVHVLALPLHEYALYGLGLVILAYNGALVALTRLAQDTDQNLYLRNFRRLMIVQVILDWLSMAVFIHLTGGITSPGILLFSIHVVMVTILLPGQSPYIYAVFAVLVVLAVTILERADVLPHAVVIPGIDPDLHHNVLFIVSQVIFFSVGSFAAVSLTASIMKRLRERERQVIVLLQTVRDTSSTLETNVVLEKLVRHAAEALSVTGASIRLLDPTGEELAMAASYGLSQSYLEKGPVELSQSRLDLEALSGAVVIVGHAAQDPRVQYPKEMAIEGINSILVVPVVGRQPLGVLRVYSNAPDHFKWEDADFLHAIAHQSAAAIENALTHEALQRAEQQRTQFIRQITHELRAPVTGAQSLLRVLLHNMAGEVAPQQRDILARLEHRMNALLELITDLLALAASKSIDREQPLEPVALQPVVQAVLDGLMSQAAEKRIRLTLDTSAASVSVKATEDGIKCIVENLAGNAVKYTPDGGSVRVRITRKQNCAHITVRDTGIGIPEEALDKLGEEFYRAPNARRSGIPGTGLGIAIVKQFVASFGGLMRIQSTVGAGTTMTISLPLADAHATADHNRGAPPMLLEHSDFDRYS